MTFTIGSGRVVFHPIPDFRLWASNGAPRLTLNTKPKAEQP